MATMRVYRRRGCPVEKASSRLGGRKKERRWTNITSGYRYGDKDSYRGRHLQTNRSGVKKEWARKRKKKKRRLDGKPVDPSKGVEPGFCYSMGLFGSIAVGLQGTMAAYLLKHLKPLSQPAIRPLAFFILIKSIHPLPFDAGGAFPHQSIAYLVFASLTFCPPILALIALQLHRSLHLWPLLARNPSNRSPSPWRLLKSHPLP